MRGWVWWKGAMLARGDTDSAREHFERTLALGVTTFLEYATARAELDRMGTE